MSELVTTSLTAFSGYSGMSLLLPSSTTTFVLVFLRTNAIASSIIWSTVPSRRLESRKRVPSSACVISVPATATAVMHRLGYTCWG